MNPSDIKSLAIVIPAYKTAFLRETLESIAAQTNKNFEVYVFDDCSPGPVGEIVREFEGKLLLKYHRFPENMGGKSLVKHWERCLRLTHEPWIWLFSDDDTMDEQCVAAFFDKLKKTDGSHDAYRFNTRMIDATGKVLSMNNRHPDEESGTAFLLERWSEKRNSYLQELIFSRKAWETAGGIPDFALAWHSDDAFIAQLGVRRPIKSIPEPRMNWRWSNANITGDHGAGVMAEKIRGTAEFVPWALEFFRKHDPTHTASAARLTEQWFFKYLSWGWHFLGLAACMRIEGLCSRSWGHWPGLGFLRAMRLNFKVGVLKVTNRVRKVFINHAKNPLPDQPRP